MHRFAAIGVGRADDRRLAHAGKGVEHVLDLARPDLEAGGRDHVLLAVDQIEPAGLVEEADVAGVHPAARSALPPSPRACANSPPSRRGRARRPRRVRRAPSGRLASSTTMASDAGRRNADRERARLRVDRDRPVGRREVARRRQLRHAVGAADRAAEALRERLDHRRRDRRAAGIEMVEAGEMRRASPPVGSSAR